MTPTIARSRKASASSQSGFTLLEIMVALILGLLLSIGILSLFGSTSHSNKVQNGLARLQENGRFAVSRIESDLRMLGGQACSNFSGNATTAADHTPVWTARAPKSYVSSLAFPDLGAPFSGASGYNIDPSAFVKGYECAGGCTIPALGSYSGEALTADSRVPNSDVLTIRYQTGSGWPVAVGTCARGAVPLSPSQSIESGDVMGMIAQAGNDPFPTTAHSAMLIASCSGSAIIPVAGATLDADRQPLTLTVGAVLPDAPSAICLGNPTTDVRAYDMGSFVTVTYFLAFRANDDPDANGRLVPTLVRRENGGASQDLVQGVDQLDFLYGVLDATGATRYMSAADIDDSTDFTLCTPPPDGISNAAGCLWRNVRSVEAHLLVNTTSQVFGLDDLSRSFRYQGVDTAVASDGSTVLASGQTAGSMLRREFVAHTMIRNRNP